VFWVWWEEQFCESQAHQLHLRLDALIIAMHWSKDGRTDAIQNLNKEFYTPIKNFI